MRRAATQGMSVGKQPIRMLCRTAAAAVASRSPSDGWRPADRPINRRAARLATDQHIGAEKYTQRPLANTPTPSAVASPPNAIRARTSVRKILGF